VIDFEQKGDLLLPARRLLRRRERLCSLYPGPFAAPMMMGPYIGTPTLIGVKANNAASSTVVIPVGVDVPPGSFVLVCGMGNVSAPAFSSVADSAGGNTYALLDTATANPQTAYASPTVNKIPNGGTITITLAGSTNPFVALAFFVPGMRQGSGVVDTVGSVTSGAATSATSSNTGTLGYANDLIVGLVGSTNQDVKTGLAAAGYTIVGSVANGTANSLGVGWKKVTVTTTSSWAPSWTNSSNYSSFVRSFKGAA
jgi:hypothetical protein